MNIFVVFIKEVVHLFSLGGSGVWCVVCGVHVRTLSPVEAVSLQLDADIPGDVLAALQQVIQSAAA